MPPFSFFPASSGSASPDQWRFFVIPGNYLDGSLSVDPIAATGGITIALKSKFDTAQKPNRLVLRGHETAL
jgi:hypothetical protein